MEHVVGTILILGCSHFWWTGTSLIFVCMCWWYHVIHWDCSYTMMDWLVVHHITGVETGHILSLLVDSIDLVSCVNTVWTLAVCCVVVWQVRLSTEHYAVPSQSNLVSTHIVTYVIQILLQSPPLSHILCGIIEDCLMPYIYLLCTFDSYGLVLFSKISNKTFYENCDFFYAVAWWGLCLSIMHFLNLWTFTITFKFPNTIM